MLDLSPVKMSHVSCFDLEEICCFLIRNSRTLQMPQVKLGAGVGVGEGVVVVEVDLLFSAEGGQALAVNSVGAGGNEMRAGERVVVKRLGETADVECRVVRYDGFPVDERLELRPEAIKCRHRFGI